MRILVRIFASADTTPANTPPLLTERLRTTCGRKCPRIARMSLCASDQNNLRRRLTNERRQRLIQHPRRARVAPSNRGEGQGQAICCPMTR